LVRISDSKDKEMNKKYGLDRFSEIDKLKENFKDLDKKTLK
jgi:hypothetical protein